MNSCVWTCQSQQPEKIKDVASTWHYNTTDDCVRHKKITVIIIEELLCYVLALVYNY